MFEDIWFKQSKSIDELRILAKHGAPSSRKRYEDKIIIATVECLARQSTDFRSLDDYPRTPDEMTVIAELEATLGELETMIRQLSKLTYRKLLELFPVLFMFDGSDETIFWFEEGIIETLLNLGIDNDTNLNEVVGDNIMTFISYHDDSCLSKLHYVFERYMAELAKRKNQYVDDATFRKFMENYKISENC